MSLHEGRRTLSGRSAGELHGGRTMSGRSAAAEAGGGRTMSGRSAAAEAGGGRTMSGRSAAAADAYDSDDDDGLPSDPLDRFDARNLAPGRGQSGRTLSGRSAGGGEDTPPPGFMRGRTMSGRSAGGGEDTPPPGFMRGRTMSGRSAGGEAAGDRGLPLDPLERFDAQFGGGRSMSGRSMSGRGAACEASDVRLAVRAAAPGRQPPAAGKLQRLLRWLGRGE